MEASKRILVFAAGNYISGAEKVMLDVIGKFKENGYHIHCLVSGWNDGNFIRKLNELNVEYTVIKLGWYYISKLMWSLDSLIHYPQAVWGFLKLKRDFRPNVVYTMSYRQIVLLFPFFKKNIIYHSQDPNSQSKVSRFFLGLIDKKILKYIASSQSIKKDLQKIGIEEKKIVVIYNGVDLPVDNIKTFFSKPRIGIVGQLIYRKGHVVLLEAAKLLKDKYQKQFVIYVIGSGDQKYTNGLLEYVYQNNLEAYVQFKGHMNITSEIYSSIDFTVVPSFSEAFGLIAVESYFYKIPVIASRVGGLEEIVVHEKTGYLVTPGNAEELASKINLFLESPALIKKMADEGFEYCRSRFLKDTMLTNVMILFDNI